VEVSVGDDALQFDSRVRLIAALLSLATQITASSQFQGAKHSHDQGALQQIVLVFSILSQVFGAAIRKRKNLSEDALILQVAHALEEKRDRVSRGVGWSVHD
jgi:hypothetical protein